MGQIVSSAAKSKRCNINQLSQVSTPAAGEHILVSSNNSMNAAGQGNFDCYIVGDGTTAATALELQKIVPSIDSIERYSVEIPNANAVANLVDTITGRDVNYVENSKYTNTSTATAEGVGRTTDYVPCKKGDVLVWNSGIHDSTVCLQLYNASKGRIDYFTANQESGKRSITITKDDAAYFRFSFDLSKIDEAYVLVNNTLKAVPQGAVAGIIPTIQSNIDALERDKEVLLFTGKGNDFVSQEYIGKIEGGKPYRVHMLNPDYARDEVTASSTSVLWEVYTTVDGTTNYLARVTIGDATIKDCYDFVAPEGCQSLFVGGRANNGVMPLCTIEEIKVDDSRKIFESEVELNGKNYDNGYVNSSGNIVYSDTYGHSIAIPCAEGSSIVWRYATTGTQSIYLCFYAADGSFIDFYSANGSYGCRTLIVKAGTSYAVASFKLSDINNVFVSIDGIVGWIPTDIKEEPLIDKLSRKVRPYESLTLGSDDFEYGSLQGGGTGAPVYFNNNAYSRFIKVIPGSKLYFHYKTLSVDGGTAEIRVRVQARVNDNFTDGGSWRLVHTGYSQIGSLTVPSGYNYISVGIGYYKDDVSVKRDILDIYNSGLSISSDSPLEISHNYFDEMDLLSINSNDIVTNNDPKEYQGIMANMKRARKVGSSSTTSTPPPLVMLHFSDIHGDAMNVRRIVRFYKHYQKYIDDVIHTGDTVYNTVADPSYLWDTDDTKWWLNVIGNHDVNGDTSENPALTAYNRFFAPYIANWNVTQPDDASDGKPYYYKDYADNKIRLIVLNCMSYDTAQNIWFVSILNDVLTNHADYSVIVSQHYPMNGTQSGLLDCNFTSYVEQDNRTSTGMPNDIINAVDDFISAGGKFVCHIAGHTHKDIIGYSSQSIKKQMFITADTANCHQPGWDDGDRTSGTKMQDAFNIICFDTYSGLVKILKVGKTWNQHLQHAFNIVIKYDETGVEIPTVVNQN